MDPCPQTEDDASKCEPQFEETQNAREQNTESKESQALDQLNRTIQLLPEQTRGAYGEALKHAPHVVDIESNPRHFLTCNDGAQDAAAKQVVLYWERRKAIFGDRAFLTMDATGRGALTFEDIEWMKAGFFMILPEKDASGRTVICCDRSRMIHSLGSQKFGLRAVFYMLTVAAENERSRTDGVVFVTRVSESSASQRTKQSGVIDLLRTMPIRFHSSHLACCPPKASLRMFQDVMIPLTINAYTGIPSQVHIGDDTEDLLAKLRLHGLSKTMLPQSLGGLWDYANVHAWIDERAALEGAQYRKVKMKDGAGGSRSGSLNTIGTSKKRSTREAEGSGSIAEFQRPMKSIPGDTIAASALAESSTVLGSGDEAEEQVFGWDQIGDGDQSDDSSHRKCLSSGCVVTGPKEAESEARAALLRKRNALYSKRKYYKKKRKIRDLIQDRCCLETENKDLRNETARLEGLLADAQAQVALHDSVAAVATPSVPDASAVDNSNAPQLTSSTTLSPSTGSASGPQSPPSSLSLEGGALPPAVAARVLEALLLQSGQQPVPATSLPNVDATAGGNQDSELRLKLLSGAAATSVLPNVNAMAGGNQASEALIQLLLSGAAAASALPSVDVGTGGNQVSELLLQLLRSGTTATAVFPNGNAAPGGDQSSELLLQLLRSGAVATSAQPSVRPATGGSPTSEFLLQLLGSGAAAASVSRGVDVSTGGSQASEVLFQLLMFEAGGNARQQMESAAAVAPYVLQQTPQDLQSILSLIATLVARFVEMRRSQQVPLQPLLSVGLNSTNTPVPDNRALVDVPADELLLRLLLSNHHAR